MSIDNIELTPFLIQELFKNSLVESDSAEPVKKPDTTVSFSTLGHNRKKIIILVANDEPALRQAVVPILRANGYCVLEAQTADHALEIAQQTRGYLDVLLTNIGVPGMRGTELASRVVAVHPEVQVIYMSGYAAGVQESALLENSVFFQKPSGLRHFSNN